VTNITNDGLTWFGRGCFIAVLYPYGNSGRQRVKYTELKLLSVCLPSADDRLTHDEYRFSATVSL